jgi:hypothetical protein
VNPVINLKDLTATEAHPGFEDAEPLLVDLTAPARGGTVLRAAAAFEAAAPWSGRRPAL